MQGEIEVTQEVKVTIELYRLKVRDLISALHEKYIDGFPSERKQIERELKDNFPHLMKDESQESIRPEPVVTISLNDDLI